MPEESSPPSGTLAPADRCRVRRCGRPRIPDAELPDHAKGNCDHHLLKRHPTEAMRRRRKVGKPEPRLFTKPLRPLTRKTTRGYEVIDFARDVLGEPLLPWQERLVIRALELNPDGTYRFRVIVALVARQNGKTHLSRVLTLWRMYVDGARMVLGVGQDVSLAREVWQACIDTINEVPELAAEMGKESRRTGDEWFKLESGARYKIAAANRSAARGLSCDHINMDEIREQRNWDAWAAISKTTNARPYAQIWAISNAGDDESVVLNRLREVALAGTDDSIGLFEWSAPDGCDLDDWDAIAQANPGLGHTVTEQAIRTALATDPPNVYRTEVLCQRVENLNEAISLQGWKDGKDTAGSLDGLRDRVALCVDVAPDGAHVTLAAAARLDDGRVRLEVVAAWKSTEEARRELPDWLVKVNPRALAWYPSGPAAALAAVLRPPELANGKKLKQAWETIELTGAGVTTACQEFADLVAARRVVHPDDPLMNAHVAGAQKYMVGDGWRFVRRGAGHVDAAYAGAGACRAALSLPEPVRPRVRWIS